MSDKFTPRLPFFVYGTLIPGQPNFRIIEEFAPITRPGQVQGRLYGLQAAFPFYIPSQTPDEEGVVKGVLLEFEEPDFPEVVRRLDQLEGVPTFYRRAITLVLLEDGSTVSAYIYTPAKPEEIVSRYKRIMNGDWVRRRENYIAETVS